MKATEDDSKKWTATPCSWNEVSYYLKVYYPKQTTDFMPSLSKYP